MKRVFKYLLIFLVAALSGCDDEFLTEYDTRNDEYTVYYYVKYSTVYNFHDIAYVSFTDFFDDDFKYTGKPRQEVTSIEGTSDFIEVRRVPKGAHLEFSTFVDVEEALSNTKAEISIAISRGNQTTLTEVATAQADCPLKATPLTLTYDIPVK